MEIDEKTPRILQSVEQVGVWVEKDVVGRSVAGVYPGVYRSSK